MSKKKHHTDKIRIIVTITQFLHYDQRMIKICHSLSEAGYNVTLVGRGSKHDPLVSYPFKVKVLDRHISGGFLFYAWYNIRLFFFLLFTRSDVIYSVDLDTSMPGRWASIVKGNKWIYDSHELFLELPELEGRTWVRALWGVIQKLSVWEPDLALTVNQSLSEILNKEQGIKFLSIENRPRKSDYHPPSESKKPSSPFRLIYQGSVNVGRGVELYIDGISQLSGCELHIVGEGDVLREMKEKVSRLKLEDIVYFHGKISPTLLRKLTATMHVGLNMLDGNSKNYYYSLANKVYDYLHAEIPSINMRYPEYVRLQQASESILLVEQYSTDEFVKVIKELQDKPEGYVGLVSNCLAHREDYIWEQEEKKFLSALSDIF